MTLKRFTVLSCAAALAVPLVGSTARADDPLRISELFWDAPGSLDNQRAYIELRGTPGQSLNNKYLVFTENEQTTSSSNISGQIDNVFDLSGMTIGTNGFLLLLPKNFDRGLSHIAPGTAVYQNQGSVGFGSAGFSTIGHNNQSGSGDIENGAFSAILLDRGTGVAPTTGFQLDAGPGTTGRIDPIRTAGWSLLDSVGQAEEGEHDGYTYGSKVYFTKDPVSPQSHKDTVTTNVFTDLEVEYLARYGSQHSGNPSDWFMANITDDRFSYNPDNYQRDGYVVSGNHVPANPLPGEIVRGLATDDVAPGYQSGSRNIAPEGTVIQNNLGRANWPIFDGDLNQDGFVGQADLSIVLGNWGQTDASQLGYWYFGDASGDGFIGQADLSLVLGNWGAGVPIQAMAFLGAPELHGLGADTSALDGSPWNQAVPEPAGMALIGAAAFGLLYRRRAARAVNTGQ